MSKNQFVPGSFNFHRFDVSLKQTWCSHCRLCDFPSQVGSAGKYLQTAILPPYVKI